MCQREAGLQGRWRTRRRRRGEGHLPVIPEPPATENRAQLSVTLDLSRGLLDFMSSAAKRHNSGSLLCQQYGRSLPDTRPSPGDKRYFACQSHYTSFLFLMFLQRTL